MSQESEFQKRLEEIFRAEALEHRQAILTGLLEIEKGAGTERETQLVETIFREAHSLKGAARAVKMTRIEALCQSLESVFSVLKKGRKRLLPQMYDTLFRMIDRIEQLEKGTEGNGPDPDFLLQLAAMRETLAGAGSPANEPPVPPPLPLQGEKQGARIQADDVPETIRVSSARMGTLYLKTEELLTVREAARKRAETLLDLAASQQAWRSRAGGVRRHARKMLRLKSSFGASMGPDLAAACTAVVDFIEADCVRESDVASAVTALSRSAAEDATRVSELVDALLKEVRSVLMLPFSSLLELFPRMVRDLAREEGRQVRWSVEGEEIEVDRRVLEGIKDPLIHLVRNCVSHGIEKPAVRKERGKPGRGPGDTEDFRVGKRQGAAHAQR